MKGQYRKIEKGSVFGRLTVLEELSERGKHGIILKCVCACGTVIERPKSHVISLNTASCGCAKIDSMRATAKLRWLSEGEAAFNGLFSKYKIGARDRNYEFSLTKEEFRALTRQPCAYCGVPPSQVTTWSQVNGVYTYSGVDRVDNTKGYTVSNVVSCCKQCQYAKRDQKVEDFLAWAKRLSAHQTFGQTTGEAAEIQIT